MRTFVHVQNFIFGPAFSTDHRRSPTITSVHQRSHNALLALYQRPRTITNVSLNIGKRWPERYGVTGTIRGPANIVHNYSNFFVEYVFLDDIFVYTRTSKNGSVCS